MKGGKGCAVADLRGDSLHIFLCHLLKLVKVIEEPLPALIENSCPGCILHALDEPVNLLQLNALQVISNRHVELEPVHGTKAVFLSQHLTCEPCFHILVKCLGNIQLRGPLTVIALVIRLDTWLCNRKVLAVQLLYGLQFKETAAGYISRNNILGQLGVGACRGTKGCLQLAAEYLIILFRVCLKRFPDSENSTFFVLF